MDFLDESLARVREFCSFGYDQKYVDLVKECDDREKGKVNFYYGAPLVLFVCYDTTACRTHPRNGKPSGATDAAIWFHPASGAKEAYVISDLPFYGNPGFEKAQYYTFYRKEST